MDKKESSWWSTQLNNKKKLKKQQSLGKWPLLVKLAKRFLSAPCGLVESERLFSKAGLICTDLRNRLSEENMRKLLFLSSNLPIVDFEY
ncbi:BED-type domain-containing protein [Meloidogyne graminicola]|uniref:BED-type domain-containing protein n=1 Tax=Meloidogyne graminicola TaxID=189291 RepID=A0A8S9ZVX8_9BILA|nr:BED-type domain-containing protein [Meloidogyne graminicola]